ncbi:MAG: hypothetical protein NTZ63_07365, partial [Candidatus Omnitrophica bacterium]|nr:hypothetical protein [Candidatus Omnitrophota bacterium]
THKAYPPVAGPYGPVRLINYEFINLRGYAFFIFGAISKSAKLILHYAQIFKIIAQISIK